MHSIETTSTVHGTTDTLNNRVDRTCYPTDRPEDSFVTEVNDSSRSNRSNNSVRSNDTQKQSNSTSIVLKSSIISVPFKSDKQDQLCHLSLQLFSKSNPIRKCCIRITSSKVFDILIIFAILINSAFLGLTDYSIVDNSLNPSIHGFTYKSHTVTSAHSNLNWLVQTSEPFFISIFALECVIKVIAMGFVRHRKAYLRDAWNILDFVVVTMSIIGIFPNIPNVSVIRTIRVLRPLRSLSMIPGMRRLISALLKALPALANVVILQIFVFFIFGILGIQLFGGIMTRRCRLTPFPVRLPVKQNVSLDANWPVSDTYLQTVMNDPASYACLKAPLLDYDDLNSKGFRKENSPWRHPQHCFWPLNDSDQSLCSSANQPGMHKCSATTVCGSDYDCFGNPRFKNARVMRNAYFSINYNFGYTTFDNIGKAFFSIFQAITQEGWTLTMYMTMDTSQPIIAALFFILLMIFASLFLMNLTLAVISDEFNLEEKEEKQSMHSLLSTVSSCSILKTLLMSDKNERKQEACNNYRYWTLIKARLHAIVSHWAFSTIIMIAIIANTTVLALDHYPMPAKLDSDLEIVNFGLSCVFFVEMLMKLIGLGIFAYSEDGFNLFDAFIVTMSIVETITSPPSVFSKSGPSKGGVSALRAFRLFRIFKLARNWTSLRELLAMIIRAVASIANFAVLLFLFIYIYALVGIQLYANTMRFDDLSYPIHAQNATDLEFWSAELPRSNFDSLIWACVTVFQVISEENWNNVMYDVIRANGFSASLYFLSLVILGKFILMNLFLALLLDNFAQDNTTNTQARQEDLKRLADRMSPIKVAPFIPLNVISDATVMDSRPRVSQTLIDDVALSSNTEVEHMQNSLSVSPISVSTPRKPVIAQTIDRTTLTIPKIVNHRIGTYNFQDLFDQILAYEQTIARQKPRERPFFDNKPVEALEAKSNWHMHSLPLPPKGHALFLLSENNIARRIAFAVTTHPLFDAVILAFIAISSIALAIDNPLSNPNDTAAKSLKVLEKFCTILFTVEMMLKIMSLGLVLHKDSYLQSHWNVLDGVIVITSWVTLIAESSDQASNLKSLRPLRCLRAFRPLRMISRRPGLKLVVNALFESVPAVLNVLFVCFLFYLIFSIVAVNYLKGTFFACSGPVFESLSEEKMEFLLDPQPWHNLTVHQKSWFDTTVCNEFKTFVPYEDAEDLSRITSKYVCKCWGAKWAPPIPWNFNNVAWALLTFYELSTTEGWVTVMTQAIDATDVDMQPIRDNQMKWAFFFVAFIMIGSFFVVNLFVGVIIDNFNRMKAALGGDFMLTTEQKKWIEAQKAALRVGPVRAIKVPKNPKRKWCFNLVRTSAFEWGILACIIVNTILMAMQYFGAPTLQAQIIHTLNEIFAVVFTIEAVLKGFAYGLDYFSIDTWNVFDFFVVVGTLLSVIVEALTGTSVRSLAMLIRVFRVTRVIRLIKASKSIRHILTTLYVALPGLSNISSILFLMLFIYATMGVQLFAKVALENNIDSHANFQSFWSAMLLLLRASTGEAWDAIMHDYALHSPDCVPDPPYNPNMCGFNNFDGCTPLNGCGNRISFVYFCSFTLLVTYVLLNLTIAVILEGFSSSHVDEEPLFEPALLQEFRSKWSVLDPKAEGYIRVRALRVFANILEPPLGIGTRVDSQPSFIRFARRLHIPLYSDEVIHFRDVLLAMTREVVKQTLPDTLLSAPDVGNAHSSELFRRRLDFYAHEYFAATQIQRVVLIWLRTKRKLEAQYMEEYKNKIKKTNKRPRKIRDARVYTIG